MLFNLSSDIFFKTNANMRMFTSKLGTLITENLQTKQILLACFGVLLVLHEKNPNSLITNILALTPNHLANVNFEINMILS